MKLIFLICLFTSFGISWGDESCKRIENNYWFLFKSTCYDNQVIKIEEAKLVASYNTNSCSMDQNCEDKSVMTELMFKHKPDKNYFQEWGSIPQSFPNCHSNYNIINGYFKTTCLPGYQVYNLNSRLNEEKSESGNFYIFYYSEGNIQSFNPLYFKIENGYRIIIRFLELCAKTQTTETCPFTLKVLKDQEKYLICLENNFRNSYLDLGFASPFGSVVSIELLSKTQSSLEKLKVWAWVEVRDRNNQNTEKNVVKLSSNPIINNIPSTTTKTTTVTTTTTKTKTTTTKTTTTTFTSTTTIFTKTTPSFVFSSTTSNELKTPAFSGLSEQKKIGIGIGVALAFLLLLILLSLLIYFCCISSKKKPRQKETNNISNQQQNANNFETVSTVVSLPSYKENKDKTKKEYDEIITNNVNNPSTTNVYKNINTLDSNEDVKINKEIVKGFKKQFSNSSDEQSKKDKYKAIRNKKQERSKTSKVIETFQQDPDHVYCPLDDPILSPPGSHNDFDNSNNGFYSNTFEYKNPNNENRLFKKKSTSKKTSNTTKKKMKKVKNVTFNDNNKPIENPPSYEEYWEQDLGTNNNNLMF